MKGNVIYYNIYNTNLFAKADDEIAASSIAVSSVVVSSYAAF